MKGVRYNQGDEIIEITIRDSSGARQDVRRANKLDDEENGKWLMWLIRKWGVRFKIPKGFLDLDSEFLRY